MLKHLVVGFFAAIVLRGPVLSADSRDDVSRAKSDFESLRARHDELESNRPK